jgi:Stage II sporulation protein E (SpoIIE)
MADQWDRHNPPRLLGYESWLYQMPCINSSGDVFVSVPLPQDADLPGEPPNGWLVAVGDVSGKGEDASRLKDRLESEVVVFHSDGMTAVIDHQSNILDLNSLTQAIADARGDAASVGQSILEAIRHFRRGQAQVDDITLLCLGRQVTHERQC